MLGGDVEMNPGPGPVTGQNERSSFTLQGQGQGSGRSQRNTRSTSRQPTLQANETGELTVSSGTAEAGGMDLYGLIMSLKSDLNKGMDGINKSINVINTAINEVSDVCQQLQRENEQLRDNNLKMSKRLERVESELEKVDALSRKQNLLIDGYDGSCDETPLTTSHTVRNILRDDFLGPNADDIAIEKSHRMRHGGPHDKPTIFVRFQHVKDKELVLKHARENLSRDSHCSASEDYTARVRKHRYELGKRMVEAKNRNQYSVVRYDKLIIDDRVYKYDEKADDIKFVGKNRFRRSTRLREEARANENGQQQNITEATNENRTHDDTTQNEDVSGGDTTYVNNL